MRFQRTIAKLMAILGIVLTTSAWSQTSRDRVLVACEGTKFGEKSAINESFLYLLPDGRAVLLFMPYGNGQPVELLSQMQMGRYTLKNSFYEINFASRINPGLHRKDIKPELIKATNSELWVAMPNKKGGEDFFKKHIRSENKPWGDVPRQQGYNETCVRWNADAVNNQQFVMMLHLAMSEFQKEFGQGIYNR